MNSCLYECTIMHDRQKPKRYQFVHKIFMFYLDLDELPQLSRYSWFLGYNQHRIYNFKDSDHISSGYSSIKENIRTYLKNQGVEQKIHRIQLMTNVRTFGYIFNPVSFYFCFDSSDTPVCVVSEIGNTFGELKYFYLGPDKKSTKAFSDRQVKYYYISPFTDLDNQLDFRIQVPDERLNISIDTLKNGEKFFWSSMTGPRKQLTNANLLWYTIKYPWVTLKVIFLIHWHAAMLHFFRKVAHHAKEENPELQRDIQKKAYDFKGTGSFRAWNKINMTFSEKVIDRVFTPLKLGQLTITWPDGAQKIYGHEPDGITAEIHVRHHDFFRKCLFYGDVGFGEAYVDGDWDTPDLARVIEWMILNVEHHPTLMADAARNSQVNWFRLFNTMAHKLRDNTLMGSHKNISAHYDLGNDFFKTFLDPSMAYSSAYFTSPAQSMHHAQVAKFDAWCKKLRLKPTDRVLEIGCGWGGFAVYAARHYGCHMTCITISKEQYTYCQELIAREGLQDKINLQFVDYRHVEGLYDKIISIEMIEAVGHKFLPVYFKKIHHLLKRDGVVGLQMILAPDHRYESFRKNVDFIQKHVFPGSLLPSLRAIQQAIHSSGILCVFDYEDISFSYATTLKMWREEFNRNRSRVVALGFDEPFIRKWNYYLSYCEAAFRMRNIAVAQVVLARPNNYLLV